MLRKIAPLLCATSVILAACTTTATPSVPLISPTPSLLAALTPYQVPTLQPFSPTPTFVITIAVTPSPTPTPFLHTITNDDTMLGLALRYGVKLEDLKTANPTVIPNAMTVGSQLVIPISTPAPEQMPSPTTLPIQAGEARCYPAGDGGAWCVSSVTNTTPSSLEDLSAWIGLYDAQGKNIASQVVYATLNLLRHGSTMPLLAYFAPPLPAKYSARSELLTASAVLPDAARYMDASAEVTSMDVNIDGSQATVAGEVILPAGSPTPSQVWVLVVAYDAAGNILGTRKWKSATETSFTTTVYSLGGVIDHVDLLVEVRP